METVVSNIRGIKIAYPSTGADLKGLLKSAYYDPNPVVIFEHKGLYWSKVPGTEEARTIEPDADYCIPFGKARVALEADASAIENAESMAVITYGMGVYWATNAAKEQFSGRVKVLDLRTLFPVSDNPENNGSGAAPRPRAGAHGGIGQQFHGARIGGPDLRAVFPVFGCASAYPGG